MSFCTQCGAKLEDAAAFCTGCGAPANVVPRGADSANMHQPREIGIAGGTANPRSNVAKSAPRGGSALPWFGAIAILFVAAVAAGVVYAGHVAKQRISAAIRTASSTSGNEEESAGRGDTGPAADGQGGEKTTEDNRRDGGDPNVAKGLDAIGGLMDKMGFGDRPADPYEKLPTITAEDAGKLACAGVSEDSHPFGRARNHDGSTIPFRENLALTAAWGRKFGDVESTSTISSIKQDFIEVSNSGTYFKFDDDQVGNPDSSRRDVCWQDLQNAHGYVTGYKRSYPLIAPEATASFLSATAFHELKSQGKTTLRYLVYLPAEEGYRLHWQEAVLTRVEPGDVQYQVIVNDEPKSVPAIHATGTMLTTDAKARELSKNPLDQPLPTELVVLDDPDNPIVLLYRMDIGAFRIQVIRITFPEEKPEKKIEEGLAKNKRVVVYGIYFDYNSDQIKKESEPVLKEIAQALKNNPDWKLTVDGHTDNIGGDGYNLDLSKRRSAAVKKALVERYGIGSDRLLTDGYGMRRPVDRNDTLEGRAKNRRVELSRE